VSRSMMARVIAKIGHQFRGAGSASLHASCVKILEKGGDGISNPGSDSFANVGPGRVVAGRRRSRLIAVRPQSISSNGEQKRVRTRLSVHECGPGLSWKVAGDAGF